MPAGLQSEGHQPMVHLSTSECAGQVIVAGFGAGDPPEALCELARAGKLGGFVLFRRNLGAPAQIAELTLALTSLAPADRPLWMSVDQEGGRVARLGPPVVTLPPMRVLGEIDDPTLTRDAALVLGRQLRLLGFNLDFAPVLDVDTNPDNPVIGDRSFGREAERVIVHGRAFAAGLESAGVAACGKHFPGHGDTHVDSHFALPRLMHARERLDRVELAPFTALLPELPNLMTAHVLFDALDPARPATLSPKIIRELLRGELGYGGVIWSDDLEMKAISEQCGVDEAACAAIAAGCDSVLICSNTEQVLAAQRALSARAEREPDFAERLRDAAMRSLSARMDRSAQPAAGALVEQLLGAQGAAAIETRIARARVGVAH
jgi:beta-N-acetylhexosaminidase